MKEFGSLQHYDEVLFKESNANFEDIFGLKNYNNIYFLNLARNSIKIILENTAINDAVLMPSYLCSSVKQAFRDCGVTVYNYKIDENFNFNINDMEKIIEKYDIRLVYINIYFSLSLSEDELNFIYYLKKQNITIIEDRTHSLFNTGKGNYFGDFVIASFRKWFPLADGAYLLSNTKINMKSVKNKSSKASEYMSQAQILKKYYLMDIIPKKFFYDKYQKALRLHLVDKNIYTISNVSYDLLSNIDFEKIILKHKNNYMYLKKLFRDSRIENKVKLFNYNSFYEVPFGGFMYVKNRNELRSYLAENNIFTNVFWDDIEIDNEQEKTISNSILMIPIDWRYDKKDIRYIWSRIESFYEKG